jgi:hypothetical protein
MKLQNSQYRLRIIIGILGMLLPILIYVNHKDLLSSISHYYYTSSSVFFIGILFSFGLVLIAYRGYPIDPDSNEKYSDDWITTLAGIFIIVTVVIPTSCKDSLGDLQFCAEGYLFGHGNKTIGIIHLISAGAFLFFLGLMCYGKFTMGKSLSLKKKRLYKICGILIWICIGLLIVLFVLEWILNKDFNSYLPGYTFYLETLAVWAFGIAWLVKGKAHHWRRASFSS